MTLPVRADQFDTIARYYDPIMAHVDYDRWVRLTAALAELLPRPVRYLDAACGTGTLLERLGGHGWRCTGADLSPAMLRSGRKQGRLAPCAVADLRALPFRGNFNLVTCLFDSINFLLEEAHVEEAFRQIHGALDECGIFYFDVITERMVLDYFEGQKWTEVNGKFQTTWDSTYDRAARLSNTKIQVNTGAAALIQERVHTQDFLEGALVKAGFKSLGFHDAESWRSPGKRTARIDVAALKEPNPKLERAFKSLVKAVRAGA